MNYYNENDVKAAAWLRQLIVARLIPEGEIDERSIQEVSAGDLEGFTQCHFFAGIGGWSYALQLAGWPDSREVWTGSCPCQPLSCAGQRKGHADERHLWPAFYALINKCRPSVVFGEQVASKDGREWFAGVRADLEGSGYAIGGADLCAASVGSPHRRQRLYWLAYSARGQCEQRSRSQGNSIQRSTDSCLVVGLADNERERLERYAGNVGNGNEPGWLGTQQVGSTSESRATGELAESDGGNEIDRELQRSGQHGQRTENIGARGLGDTRRERDERWRDTGNMGRSAEDQQGKAQERQRRGDAITDSSENGRADSVGDTEENGREMRTQLHGEHDRKGFIKGCNVGKLGNTESGRCGVERDASLARSGRHAEFSIWSRFEIVQCRDGKSRRFEPESFPLADGIPGRVALLRGYGNAIVPQVAAEFIKAASEVIK